MSDDEYLSYVFVLLILKNWGYIVCLFVINTIQHASKIISKLNSFFIIYFKIYYPLVIVKVIFAVAYTPPQGCELVQSPAQTPRTAT